MTTGWEAAVLSEAQGQPHLFLSHRESQTLRAQVTLVAGNSAFWRARNPQNQLLMQALIIIFPQNTAVLDAQRLHGMTLHGATHGGTVRPESEVLCLAGLQSLGRRQAVCGVWSRVCLLGTWIDQSGQLKFRTSGGFGRTEKLTKHSINSIALC